MEDRYVFTFTYFNEETKIVDLFESVTTKKITEQRAKELLVEQLAKRGKLGFCYSVQKGGKSGQYVNLLSNKK